MIGVYKIGERFLAKIQIANRIHNLGVHETKEEAAAAYGRFVVDKSTVRKRSAPSSAGSDNGCGKKSKTDCGEIKESVNEN